MHKILFIELLGGLGDVLIALPAIQALAASHPQAQMTVLTFAPGAVLLQQHPHVYRILQAKSGQARSAVIAALQEPYDLIVTDTTYEGITDLVEQSRAEQTIISLWRSPPANQRVSDRFLQILQAESLITPVATQTHQHPRLFLAAAEQTAVRSRLRSTATPRIGLYPDAGMNIKQWPLERFVALGKQLLRQYGAHIILPEGASRQQVEAIAAAIPGATIWPKGPLRELAALFTQLDCVVAADTGPARIAAAVGTPTVTLFGPSWQGRYGQPLPHVNLQGYPSCPERNIANFTEQTCWYSGNCPFAWDTCVNLLTSEIVADAVGSILLRQNLHLDNSLSANHQKAAPHSIQTSGVFKPKPPAPVRHHFLPTTSPTALSAWSTARNLLILRLDNIGDVLMTAPALKAIKETRPQACLTLMASPAGSLAAPLLPWVDAVLTWRPLWQALHQAPNNIEQTWELVETLRSRQFDGAIILTSFKQSPHPPALLCQLAGIPLRLGASKETGECLTQRLTDLPDDLHQVERNLNLVAAAGFQIRDRQLSLVVPPSSLVPCFPYILLNPWASCPSRMYSLERFAIAARTLSRKTGWPIMVTGTDKNRDAAAPLLAAIGDAAIDLIGKTTLSDLVALVAHAQLLLSNNTSTMHIADATQTPSVVLFAGTELKRQWRPRQAPVRLLQRPTPCSPCYSFTCSYEMECLDIPPEVVVEAGLSLIGDRRVVSAKQ